MRPKDELIRVIETHGTHDVFIISRDGLTIRFSEKQVRPMGRSAAGVRGMRLRASDEVVSMDIAKTGSSLLLMTESGYGKRTPLNNFMRKGRGGLGMIGIKLTGKKGHVVAAFMVGDDDEIVAVSSAGTTIRTPVKDISTQGRAATGVRVMSLGEGQVVASVAPILATDEI